MRVLAIGAEAHILKDNSHIRKYRCAKTYRHPVLDRKLRNERMHREARLLQKAFAAGIAVPKIIEQEEINCTLVLEYVSGPTAAAVLSRKWKSLARQIGNAIALLHRENIIHGDLTTSNIIIHGKEVVLLDFGLGFISNKVEDRAVDLHVLQESLRAKHHRIANTCFNSIIRAYRRAYPAASAVLVRLAQVNQRGRYKGKHSVSRVEIKI